MNPLDSPNQLFTLELFNPNPTSSKTKVGPVYRVSFEMSKDDWQQFMDANTAGMILEMQGRVQESHPVTEKPKGGPISKNAGMLCQEPEANEFAKLRGHETMKDYIYFYCAVHSRAELDHDRIAADKYRVLKSAYYRHMEGQ